MKVIVNPHAHGGAGLKRWEALAPHLGSPDVTIAPDAATATAAVAAMRGEHLIVAAGGDGCVNLVLNALMDPATDAPRWPVALGAIALGSSNDFHKPFDPARTLAGVPVALDPDRGGLHDVGRADWLDVGAEARTAYFLLNSSMGATARGNDLYNRATGLLAWLKARNADAAIAYATALGIWRFANVPARLWVDGSDLGLRAISNLGVVKRVHFAGSMRYDTPVRPDDGAFDVNMAEGMGRLEFVRAVGAISQGRFLGLAKTAHWRGSTVRVVPDSPAALELDGEVHTVAEVTLRVVPRALHVCG